MLIDIHTHILPGVDDGPETIGETMVMLRMALERGVNKIVVTPHYVKGSDLKKGFIFKPGVIIEHINNLKSLLDEENINIDLLPGSEVYFTPSLGKYLEDGLITTINNSRYFLLEFPSRYIPVEYINVFYDLYHLGYKPILCHPERNAEIIRDPGILYDFIKSDWVLAQVNSSSLLGIYGSRVQKTAELLVKNNLVQLIGSDCHSIGKRYPSLMEGLSYIDKINDNSSYFIENNLKITNDEKISILEPKRVNSSIFNSMKSLIALSFG